MYWCTWYGYGVSRIYSIQKFPTRQLLNTTLGQQAASWLRRQREGHLLLWTDPSWACPYKARKLKRLILVGQWWTKTRNTKDFTDANSQLTLDILLKNPNRMLSQQYLDPHLLSSLLATLSLYPGIIFTKFRDNVTMGPTMCHSTTKVPATYSRNNFKALKKDHEKGQCKVSICFTENTWQTCLTQT